MKAIAGCVSALVTVAAFLTVAALSSSAHAAAGTTCLCRTADGKSFEESTLRHSRWACDVLLGYLKGQAPARRPRPDIQTCNGEEITQFKVWICLQNGCTYAYAKAVDEKNTGLEKIEPLQGKRRP